MLEKDRFDMKLELGKYYKRLDAYAGSLNTFYVSNIVNDNAYEVWNFCGDTFYDTAMNLVDAILVNDWNSMIANGQIIEIMPPTFFIVTSRNTFEKKEEIKRAGGHWSNAHKMWYFYEKPQQFTTKEVLFFPFSGKRI